MTMRDDRDNKDSEIEQIIRELHRRIDTIILVLVFLTAIVGIALLIGSD